ncbi:MAG: DNA mismatch repair protein MutS [Candidatus Dormibacteria bacterium]
MKGTLAEKDLGSPVLRQYLDARAQHPGAILLFRLGDFYETFEEDAEAAARVLGITLTSRDFGRAGRRPMAGFPAHAADGHISRLLQAGHSVAVCDQVEDAAEAKGLVRREVTRVLTAGTVVESSMLDAGRSNLLAAVSRSGPTTGIALFEVSTGMVELMELASGEAEFETLTRVGAAEMLLPDDQSPGIPGLPLARIDAWRFEPGRGRRRLMTQLGVSSLGGFDCDDLGPALGAAGAALDYLDRNHVSLPAAVLRLRRGRPSTSMYLDTATVANLELVAGQGGGRGLLGLLDRTETPMGARLLRRWVLAPLVDAAAVEARLAAVAELRHGPELAGVLGASLRQVRDLERLTARAAQGHAGPRDLGAIRDSLPGLVATRDALGGAASPALSAAAARITPEPELSACLEGALSLELVPGAVAGASIRPGFDQQLDALRASIHEAQDWIAGLDARERERTGIRGLKVGFNRVFGYYLEVSHANRLPVPDDYLRKQTLTGAERYITPELKERESLVLNGEQAIAAREREVLGALAGRVGERAASLLASAEVAAEADCLLSLSRAAAEHGWVRPEVHDGSELSVSAGRHPLVEAALGIGRFVANDTELAPDHRLVLLTGPNMAGKSTYLRQVGLLVLLAQVGSFIPAAAASIGVVDRVFTRIGAHDAISRGLSTFMVEMVETANILHHATPRSLVIFDEIGRGTSTYDGISIAQAVLEHIHDAPQLGCRTLFATHFHELTALADRLPGVRNHRVEVAEEGGAVTFLHRIVPGGADRSYGIHVASIAGLPGGVLQRAAELLAGLERSRPLGASESPPTQQLALPIAAQHPAVRELELLDLESLTPLQALNRLAELKSLGPGRKDA